MGGDWDNYNSIINKYIFKKRSWRWGGERVYIRDKGVFLARGAGDLDPPQSSLLDSQTRCWKGYLSLGHECVGAALASAVGLTLGWRQLPGVHEVYTCYQP